MFKFLCALILSPNLHCLARTLIATKVSFWVLCSPNCWLSCGYDFFTHSLQKEVCSENKWKKSKIKIHNKCREINTFAEHRSLSIRSFKSGTRWAWLAQFTKHMIFIDMLTLGEQQVVWEPEGPPVWRTEGYNNRYRKSTYSPEERVISLLN